MALFTHACHCVLDLLLSNLGRRRRQLEGDDAVEEGDRKRRLATAGGNGATGAGVAGVEPRHS